MDVLTNVFWAIIYLIITYTPSVVKFIAILLILYGLLRLIKGVERMCWQVVEIHQFVKRQEHLERKRQEKITRKREP